MTSWLGWGPLGWLLVDALAAYRLARLVAKDSITERFRTWLRTRYAGPLVTLTTCMWCLGVWLAAAVVTLTWAAPYPWSFPASALAVAAVVGILAELV